MRTRRPPLPMFLGLAVLTIAAHLLTALVHHAAHFALGVGLPWDEIAFQLVILYAAPLLAGALLMRNATRIGATLLVASMAAAGAVGLLNHYRVLGADLVAAVPLGGWGTVFAGTAHMLLTFQIMGFAVAGVLLVKPERRATAPLPPPDEAAQKAMPASEDAGR